MSESQPQCLLKDLFLFFFHFLFFPSPLQSYYRRRRLQNEFYLRSGPLLPGRLALRDALGEDDDAHLSRCFAGRRISYRCSPPCIQCTASAGLLLDCTATPYSRPFGRLYPSRAVEVTLRRTWIEELLEPYMTVLPSPEAFPATSRQSATANLLRLLRVAPHRQRISIPMMQPPHRPPSRLVPRATPSASNSGVLHSTAPNATAPRQKVFAPIRLAA
ncbi:hypothetical protein VTK73DRAFT_2179 [Phialemonium thermophilum]|uniref:Uncharacterized protein n=1 Tax=Phialemonium thermophilum TaxID=223376 RepID=A0ABR3VSH0_9PEZI